MNLQHPRSFLSLVRYSRDPRVNAHTLVTFACTDSVHNQLLYPFAHKDRSQPSNGEPKYTIDTSVFPYTADTVGYSLLSGKPETTFDYRSTSNTNNGLILDSPRNATPRNSKSFSNDNVLSSQSRMTRIRSPTWYLGALFSSGYVPCVSPLCNRLLSTKFQPQLCSSDPAEGMGD